jgi:hypothetical protein
MSAEAAAAVAFCTALSIRRSLTRDLDARQHVQRLDHLQLGVERQRHQIVDAAERPQVLPLSRHREGAPAADPVDDALGHELLEGPAHRLAAQPGRRDEFGLGRQLPALGIPPGGDGLAQVGRHLPVGTAMAGLFRHGAQRCAGRSGFQRRTPARKDAVPINPAL